MSGEAYACCSRCPMEFGCGDFEVCRLMRMSDEEIVATTPDAERVAEEVRTVMLEAIEKYRASQREGGQ